MTAPNLNHTDIDWEYCDPLPDALHTLADAPAAYPPALLAARRAEFVRQIAERNERAMLESRLDEIAASLPTVDPETRRELEGEAADILTKIERM